MTCEWLTKYDLEILKNERPTHAVTLAAPAGGSVGDWLAAPRHWLWEGHGGSGTYTFERYLFSALFRFSDPDTAFAFKMRWG